MPVPVFYCFWFQKGCSGNILGIGRNQRQTSYFSRKAPEHRRRVGGEPGAHQRGGPRGPHPGRAPLWGGHPVDPPAPPLRLYKPFRPKNARPIDETPERLQGRRRHRETPIRGTEVSVPAPCRDGEVSPEAISIDATASIMLRE